MSRTPRGRSIGALAVSAGTMLALIAPMTPEHACDCECMENGTEDRTCKVWCHKDRCSCLHECDYQQQPEPPKEN